MHPVTHVPGTPSFVLGYRLVVSVRGPVLFPPPSLLCGYRLGICWVSVSRCKIQERAPEKVSETPSRCQELCRGTFQASSCFPSPSSQWLGYPLGALGVVVSGVVVVVVVGNRLLVMILSYNRPQRPCCWEQASLLGGYRLGIGFLVNHASCFSSGPLLTPRSPAQPSPAHALPY